MITTGHIRRSASGVPILSRDQIDELGERLVGDFQPELLTKPKELDIEAFVEFYMGLRLDFQFLSCHGRYLGMTIFNDTDKVIIYDPRREVADYIHANAGTVIIDSTLLSPKQQHRMRFTLGHEGAGHAFLHGEYYSRHPQSNALCANTENMADNRHLHEPVYLGRYAPRNDIDWMEWQADAMSSATLMPRCSVIKHIKTVQDSETFCGLTDAPRYNGHGFSSMRRHTAHVDCTHERNAHNAVASCRDVPRKSPSCCRLD